jgi:hypothetical protein
MQSSTSSSSQNKVSIQFSDYFPTLLETVAKFDPDCTKGVKEDKQYCSILKE